MALELQIKKSSVTTTQITITDTTGNYDATTNPTGYGVPNAERSDLALILKIYNKRYDGADIITDIPLVIDAYNPLTTTSWTATLNKDGWLYATVYGLKLYDVATSFELNELTYDSATSQIRKILTKAGSGPYTYTYEVITEDDLEDSSNYIIYSKTYETWTSNNICNYFNNVLIKKYFGKASARCHSDKELRECLMKDYIEFDGEMKSICVDARTGNFAEMQKTIEFLETIIDC